MDAITRNFKQQPKKETFVAGYFPELIKLGCFA